MLWRDALDPSSERKRIVCNGAKILPWLSNYREQRVSQASALKSGLNAQD